MRKGWTTKTLEDLCRKITDGVHHTPKYTKSGIPFLSVKNLTQGTIDFSNTKFVSFEAHEVLIKRCNPEYHDVLYTKVGTTGVAKVIDVEREFSLFVSVALLKPKHELIFNKYLEHFLNSSLGREQARKRTRGMANKNLVIRDIKAITVSYPIDLNEQKRIVAILDEVFAGIDNAITNTEKNLINARKLFESYLNNVFSSGWKEKIVGDIAEHSLGKMLDKRKNKGDLKPYLRNFNVRWFEFDLSDVLEMRFEEKEKDKFTALKGDVLICEGGYPGRAAIWNADEPIYFQKAVHRVRFNNSIHNRWFLYFLYLSDCTDNLSQHFSGTGIQHFTKRALHQFKLPIPSDQTIKKFVKEFDRLWTETQCLEAIYQQKLTALNELKQSILQKAFTGELTADTASQATRTKA